MQNIRTCKSCGNEYTDRQKKCSRCGQDILYSKLQITDTPCKYRIYTSGEQLLIEILRFIIVLGFLAIVVIHYSYPDRSDLQLGCLLGYFLLIIIGKILEAFLPCMQLNTGTFSLYIDDVLFNLDIHNVIQQADIIESISLQRTYSQLYGGGKRVLYDKEISNERQNSCTLTIILPNGNILKLTPSYLYVTYGDLFYPIEYRKMERD